MSRITRSELEQRCTTLCALRDALLARSDSIRRITVAGGLTEFAAQVDLALLSREIDLTVNSASRLLGRKRWPGEVGIAVPFDVPNLAAVLYLCWPFLAGYRIRLRFPSVMDTGPAALSTIWADAISEASCHSVQIVEGLSGRQFGEECVHSTEVQHFSLAGAQEVVKHYSTPAISQCFTTQFLFGPTRPKMCILGSCHKEMLPSFFVQSMFNSGQICGLYKEIIAPTSIYDEVRDILVDTLKRVDFGNPGNTVGPIKDGPILRQACMWLDTFSSDPSYEILLGGPPECGSTVIPPTVVEARSELPQNVEFFAPILTLVQADNDEEVVQCANEDKTHGLLAGLFGDEAQAYPYLSALEQTHGIVLINASMFSKPITWPYGGQGISFTFVDNRVPEEPVIRQGLYHPADELTRI